MKTIRPPSIRLLRRPAAAIALLCIGGCHDPHAVGVQLQAHKTSQGDPQRLDLQAQVTGAQAGLRYKWLSVSGECDPQESDGPATVFKFAEGATRDRVSVEVWRGDQRVAQREIDVRREAAPESKLPEPPPDVRIEITAIPPYEPEGGPDTRAEIAGKVSGQLDPEYKVVIYARADSWYIQPTPYALHSIRPDNTWESWTHTGSSYAALVVRQGFEPFLRLDVLPQVGRYVLARAIVEGARN